MKSPTRLLFSLLLSFCVLAGPLSAQNQQTVWVQIEALPTLTAAQQRASAYSSAFRNVNGFRMGSGWYAIALGPYTRADADIELRALKRERLIPADSYIAFSRQFRQQFWPVGANLLNAAPVAPQSGLITTLQPTPEPLAQEPALVPDETPRQARASERLLTGQERRELQEALQWDGFYNSTIDGAIGPGTRRAMAAWQASRGYDNTGILTTTQRQELVSGFRDVFDSLGLAQISDLTAGIEMIIPAGKVEYDSAEAPFVRYNSRDDSGVELMLISQSGDEATLFGLYDIMQTLEIVPLNGERERKSRSFVLTGQDATRHSYTYAALANGAVKGFTLVWTPADDRVMSRVIKTMRDSFTPLNDAVLPDTAGGDTASAQSIDLLSGLEIRQPERSRSGFFVDNRGTVLTTTDVLGTCSRMTIGDGSEAQISARDDTLGLALLKPTQALAPIAVAEFQSSVPRLKSEIAVSGFSYEHVLDLPSLTFGTLADLKGLRGEQELQRLDLNTLPGDAGGPVFDSSGAVVGMLSARAENAQRQLPDDVSFAVNVPAIADFLSQAGLSPRAASASPGLAPEDLTTLAADVTVLVSCWN